MNIQAKIAAIEITEDEVRLAVVKTGGRRPKILELRACPIALPDPDAVPDTAAGFLETDQAEQAGSADEANEDQRRFDATVRTVETLVEDMRSHPTAYVLCVPSQHSVARALTVPFRGKRRVASAVLFELEPYLAFPIEELAVDFVTVQEVDKETEVLTIGVRRDYLVERLAILNAAGIEPEGIGLDGIGLTALWQAGQRWLKGLNAVLHIREQGAAFAILNGRNLAYFRHLTVTAADARHNPTMLARQVQNSIRAFLAGWPGEASITCLTVTGFELFEEECALLEGELRMPVHQENLFDDLKGARRALRAAERQHATHSGGEFTGTEPGFDGAAADKANYWTAAIGVAAAATGGHYAFDFRKGDLACPGLARGSVGHVLFSSCLALLALVGVAWHFHEESNKNLDEAAVLEARIEGVTQEIDEMRESGINVSPGLFVDPPLLDILAELGDKMPDSKVRITGLRIARADLPQEWVTVTGEVKNESVFAEVFADLKQSSMFRIDKDYDYSMVGGKSTFTITVKRPQPEATENVEEY